MASTEEDWKAKVARKQASLQAKVPKEWRLPESITSLLKLPLAEHPNRLIDLDIPRRSGLLSERELQITEKYTVRSLLIALRSGEISAVEVTTAFCKRACVAGQLTNCLTETYYDEALSRARELDLARERGDALGPLHGLPISLKDSFQIAGSEATIGYVSYLDRKSEENSALVDLLLQQGAILYVKTNVPQTMMTADSENNIFGRTLNPHNTLLTAGGSTGGEGALVAFRGSILGVGTDVAGSIRIPALCDGLYGFKPTTSRVPYGGQARAGDAGNSFFLAAAGPLANDLEGIADWMEVVIGARPARFDAAALDVPWRQLQPKQQLRIGVLEPDPFFPLQPPVQRTLHEAVARLQSQGHTLVTLRADKTRIAEATVVSWAMFGLMSDGFARLRASGEPFIQSLQAGGALASKLAQQAIPRPQYDSSMTDLQRLAAVTVHRDALKESWRKLWNLHNLDVVIAPAAQCTAPLHDTFSLPAYTVLLNCLDYPACVIPFGQGSRDKDGQPFVVKPEQFCPEYDVDAADGAPCVIQVFANRMQDEECLRAAKVIDACLKG
ncbi:Acetamidase [Cyphellophora attinorum]|uniref:Acetamidase n=1 Tax=Cyphellophora attinorum TaxID=1664694 RepID=A0A0N1HA02_9EURO|nr:Acetamidase [Phialophora attinorum]KPI44635.1 Acetamidase [Phialophora attinorum]